MLVHGINRPSILVALPPEIRELIWETRMRDAGDFRFCVDIRDSVKMGDSAKRPWFLPQLCFFSNATKDEIIAVFMRNSVFMIASIHDNRFFREFIASVLDGPKHVRELHFDFFDCFPDYDKEGNKIALNSDLELAVHCTGLSTIRMTFARWRLQVEECDEENEQDADRDRTVAVLVEKYRLRRLLDCGNLRKIHWAGRYGYGWPVRVLTDLANWVEAEFAKKNHRVETIVTWGR